MQLGTMQITGRNTFQKMQWRNQIVIQVPVGTAWFQERFPVALLAELETNITVVMEMMLYLVPHYLDHRLAGRMDLFHDTVMAELDDWVNSAALARHSDTIFNTSLEVLEYLGRYTGPSFIPQLGKNPYYVTLHRFNDHFIQIGIHND